jgi:hypothetical protein
MAILAPTVRPSTASLAVLSVVFVVASGLACTPQGDPSVGPDGFTDDFERDELGDHWFNTGASWRIVDGQLNIRNARNRPLWLRRILPRDSRIEFDIRSESPDGDIKCEIYGDGTSRATSESYTATSYVIIFGGWHNSLSGIARMDEHGDDRVMHPTGTLRVVPAQTYRMRVDRRGSTVTSYIDGQQIAEMNDPSPLEGRGHDHFAFNDWEVELWIDNLSILPL